MTAFVLSPLAQADLNSIQDHLLRQSVSASHIVGDAFEEAFARLAEFPHAGHSRPDLTEKPVRFWPVYSYLIVYDPDSRPVWIARVLHAARDARRELS